MGPRHPRNNHQRLEIFVIRLLRVITRYPAKPEFCTYNRNNASHFDPM
jgi:hypothetical protein